MFLFVECPISDSAKNRRVRYVRTIRRRMVHTRSSPPPPGITGSGLGTPNGDNIATCDFVIRILLNRDDDVDGTSITVRPNERIVFFVFNRRSTKRTITTKI